jgi:hypothetical protein
MTARGSAAAVSPGAMGTGRISVTSHRPCIITVLSLRRMANGPPLPTLRCGSAGTMTWVSVVKRANRSMNS